MKDSSYPQSHISGLHVKGATRITSEAEGFPGQLRGLLKGHLGDHSDICPGARAPCGRAPTPFLENLTFPPPQLRSQRPCDDQSINPHLSSRGYTPDFREGIHRLARDSGLLCPGFLRNESSQSLHLGSLDHEMQ